MNATLSMFTDVPDEGKITQGKDQLCLRSEWQAIDLPLVLCRGRLLPCCWSHHERHIALILRRVWMVEQDAPPVVLPRSSTAPPPFALRGRHVSRHQSIVYGVSPLLSLRMLRYLKLEKMKVQADTTWFYYIHSNTVSTFSSLRMYLFSPRLFGTLPACLRKCPRQSAAP